MSDRTYIDTETRSTPNPHDTAMAVLRPEIYGEAAAWLREFHPDHYAHNPGFRDAVKHLESRRDEVASAPGAGLLDHVTAAYYRKAADSLENAGHYGSATLLRHVADDFDGRDQ